MRKNIEVKSAKENTIGQIRMMSTSIGTSAYHGTGAHKNRKYDKKSRREAGKKLCRDF